MERLAADYNVLKGGLLPFGMLVLLLSPLIAWKVRGSTSMTWMDWYNSLAKPTWTPAPATIGLIWQILYPIILVTFGFVFVQTIRRKVPWIVALPFAINLVANLIFTPIQFGMRNLPLASVDILVVWTTIIWMMVAIWRHYVGCRRPSAVLDVGVAGDRAATEHHGR